MSMSPRLTRKFLPAGLALLAFLATLTGSTLSANAQAPAVLVYGVRFAYPNLPLSGTTVGKVTRDAAGNIYFLRGSNIIEIPVSGPSQIVIPSTDASMTVAPASIAADPSGNLYVSHNNVTVNIIPRNTNGTYNTAGETSVTFTALSNNYLDAVDVAADSLGNVYIASSQGNTVAANNFYGKGILMIGPSAPSGKYLYLEPNAATLYPHSIALDASGNLFFADSTNVYEMTAASIATASPVATPIGYTGTGTCSGCTSMATPTYVYLDNNANIYVGNGTSADYIILNAGGYSTTSPTYALPSTVVGHSGYSFGTVDNQGNLVAAFSTSLEIYGASKLQIGTFPVGNGSSTTAPSGGSVGLLFTQSTTLGTTNAAAFIANIAGSTYGGSSAAQVSFNSASNTTCVAGTTYTAGQTCALEFGYVPRYAGALVGSVNVYNSTGAVIADIAEEGVVTGAAAAYDTGSKTTIGSGYTAPTGIAVDGTGAMYVADSTANTVTKFAAGTTGTGTSVGTGLSSPSGTALDTAGALYIADTGNNRILYLPNLGGGTFGTQQVLSTGSYTLAAPRGVATDSYGNVYVADTGNSRVLMVPNPLQPAVAQTVVLAGTYTSPYALAVDALNNVFIADRGANAVYEVPGGNSTTTTATVNAGQGVVASVGTGFSGPSGVAVDGSGSVYVADSGNSRIVKVPSETGVITTADQSVLFSGLARPFGIALDLTGDIYFTDQNLPAVYFAQRSAAAAGVASTIPFGSVIAGGSLTKTISLENVGLTTSLTEAVTTAAASPFTQATASNDCASAALAPGKYCGIAVSFTAPGTVGTNSTGSFIVTDNSLTVSGNTTQKVNLTGYTSGPVNTVTLTGMSSVMYGASELYTVTAKDSAGNPSAAANGSYTVSITGTATSSTTVTLSGGTGSFYLPSLGVGAYTLSVTVGGINQTLGVTVTKGTLTLMANNVSRLFDVANPTLTTTYTGFANGDTAAVVTGSAPTEATTATRLSSVGSYAITLTGGTLTAANYNIVLVNGTLTVSGAVPQKIVFTGLPNFTHGTTVTLTGYSTSGLPLTYSATGGGSSVSGNILTVGTAGTVTVTATQPGNGNYVQAIDVMRSFTAQ